MVGPVLYEASVPFFCKALQNQIQILKKGQEWCKENGHDISILTKATLGGPDMFINPPPSLQALPFHVQFCTYNAVQLLIDLGVVKTESLPIENEEQTLDELIVRLEQTLKLLDQALPKGFAGKESNMIDVSLGPFSVTREAMKYVHEISVPSL